MFGKEILVSCAFPPSLRSDVNVTRDENPYFPRTCNILLIPKIDNECTYYSIIHFILDFTFFYCDNQTFFF